MGTDKVYYKRLVNYVVGVRYFPGDPQGFALTSAFPTVAIDRENLRAFKIANKYAIVNGLIAETEEPSIDWETNNTFTDEEITELTKNYLALKSRLPKIDSLPILYKILDDAKLHERTRKILSMIQTRIDELEDEDTFASKLEDMQGVE